MSLTEAQQAALDKLPITFSGDPKTTDGVQWQTIEALHEKGLVVFNHTGMTDPDRPHEIVV